MTARNHYPSAKVNRMLAVLIAALALFLLYSGPQLLVAGISHFQAESFLQDWGKKAESPSVRAFEVAEQAATRAVRMHPASSGKYLHSLGLVYQWQHQDMEPGNPQAAASRHQALQSLRAAASQRPTWPYVWADLAYTKLMLLELDDEFGRALRQAHYFGPWRIQINRKLAQIGLMAWPAMNQAQQATTLEAMRRTVDYSSNERRQLHQFSAEIQRQELLCALLSDTKLPCQTKTD